MNDPRLIERLREQIRFIQSSCNAFDSGDCAEAKRIGTAIRMLIHDKGSNHSLLKQMDSREIKLLTTVEELPADPDKVSGMSCGDPYTHTIGRYWVDCVIPKEPRFIPVADWWEQTIFVDKDGRRKIVMSRKMIVLHTVEKDGGVHVDPTITKELETMIQDGSAMVWNLGKSNEQRFPIMFKNLGWLRKFGFELLNSPELMALAGMGL